MDVPPHPHIGLQTVSWPLEGEVLHTDSLGCEALVMKTATPGSSAANILQMKMMQLPFPDKRLYDKLDA